MKTCLVKSMHDTRIYPRSVFFEEIKNTNPYDFFIDTPWVGIIMAFEADFLILEHQDESIFANYDFIFTMYPILNKKFKKDQKLFYFELEPEDLAPIIGRSWNSLNQIPVEPYDYLLNNYEIKTNNDKNIPFHYYYDLNLFPKQEKQENLFLLQRRTQYNNDKIKIWKESDDHPHYIMKFKEYQEKLAKSEASITLCKNGASGQIVAESILSGTAAFATENKLFSKILLPSDFIIDNIDDINNKLDNKIYQNKDLLNFAFNNLYKIDYKNAKKYLLDRI